MNDKRDLLTQLARLLEAELRTAAEASDQARDGATHGESRAENKYDTRGLEAAYLAHGFSVRVQELQRDLAALRVWRPRDYTSSDLVGVGAWVGLEDINGNRRQVFIAAMGGGLKLTSAEGPVMVITPTAPLAQGLLGRALDDDVTLIIQQRQVDYQIISIR